MFSITKYKYFRESIQILQLLKNEKYAMLSIAGIRSHAKVKPEVFNKKQQEPGIDMDIRFKYPEFVPTFNMKLRNAVREKLERVDMLKRRANFSIPEFYVGSILAVTLSNEHHPEKTSRFVGLCILKDGTGLRTKFMLRNVVDNQGLDICYDLYDPKLQKIDVLRLEKRLDKDLLYLWDALPEYSYVPFDMEPEYLPEGMPVPLNPIKVKMKPIPWRCRWETRDYVGIAPVELPAIRWKLASKVVKKPLKYDLMHQYRTTVPEEDLRTIFSDVSSELQKYEFKIKRKIKKKVEFVPPTKTA